MSERTGGDPKVEPAAEGQDGVDPGSSDARRGESDPGKHDTPRRGARRAFELIRETLVVIVLALVLSALVKTFLVQPFWIPSDSMNETLVRNDRVIVSKLTPGPFDLARGDVVVFEDPGSWLSDVVPVPRGSGLGQSVKDGLAWVGLLPSQEDNHLIKRVIGLPGDHVRCCTAAGRLEVNGVEVSEPYVFPGDKPSAIPFDIRVPPGKIWVMGDHRSNSRDSRYNDTDPQQPGAPGLPGTEQPPGGKDHTGFYGSVPIDRVVGRAVAVVWPLDRLAGLGAQDGVFGRVPEPIAAAAAARSGTVVGAANWP